MERNAVRQGLRRKRQPEANRAEMERLRSANAGPPERVEAAVPLLPLSSYAAVMWKRPELDSVSNRSIEEGKRSRSTASQVQPKE